MRLGYALAVSLMLGCASESQPKPNGYLRLEYPTPSYAPFTSLTNFSMEYNSLSV